MKQNNAPTLHPNEKAFLLLAESKQKNAIQALLRASSRNTAANTICSPKQKKEWKIQILKKILTLSADMPDGHQLRASVKSVTNLRLQALNRKLTTCIVLSLFSVVLGVLVSPHSGDILGPDSVASIVTLAAIAALIIVIASTIICKEKSCVRRLREFSAEIEKQVANKNNAQTTRATVTATPINRATVQRILTQTGQKGIPTAIAVTNDTEAETPKQSL